jgi:hypothetical protein
MHILPVLVFACTDIAGTVPAGWPTVQSGAMREFQGVGSPGWTSRQEGRTLPVDDDARDPGAGPGRCWAGLLGQALAYRMGL